MSTLEIIVSMIIGFGSWGTIELVKHFCDIPDDLK